MPTPPAPPPPPENECSSFRWASVNFCERRARVMYFRAAGRSQQSITAAHAQRNVWLIQSMHRVSFVKRYLLSNEHILVFAFRRWSGRVSVILDVCFFSCSFALHFLATQFSKANVTAYDITAYDITAYDITAYDNNCTQLLFKLECLRIHLQWQMGIFWFSRARKIISVTGQPGAWTSKKNTFGSPGKTLRKGFQRITSLRYPWPVLISLGYPCPVLISPGYPCPVLISLGYPCPVLISLGYPCPALLHDSTFQFPATLQTE